jgi:hypothetical protein
VHPRVSERLRAVAWTKDDPTGMELAEVRLTDSSLAASGIAIGSDPVPYRLDYELETAEDFVTARLRVEARGDSLHETLDLRRSPEGRWSANGRELPGLDSVLDCDLGLSPLTNSMPVLRHGLLRDTASLDFVMAWVSVPDLAIHADGQRYTGLGGGVVRFESLDGTFTADIVFDEDGLVLDYPGIARRVSGPNGG